MNSFEYEKSGISEDEMHALIGMVGFEGIDSFSSREMLAIEYTKLISQTPVNITTEFIDKVKSEFNEREIVIISSTAAQVNYWARLLIALGVPPAGFSDKCDL